MTTLREIRWHPLLWLAIAALLLVPAVAMRFTAEVNWTRFDFAVAALLLGGGGLAFEAASRRLSGRALLIATGAIIAVVALLWAQGAVGIV